MSMFDDVPVSLWLSCLKNMFAEIWRVSTTASFSSSTDERVMMYCIILYRHKEWNVRVRISTSLRDKPEGLSRWTILLTSWFWFLESLESGEVNLCNVWSSKPRPRSGTVAGYLSKDGATWSSVWSREIKASTHHQSLSLRSCWAESCKRSTSEICEKAAEAFRIGNSESRGLWKRRALIALTALKVERCSHKILWQDRSPLGSLGVGVHVGPQKTWPPIRACSFRT